MRSRIVTFFIAFLVWLLLCFSWDSQHLFMGIFAAILTAWLVGDMFTDYPRKWLEPKRYIWFIIYVFVFIEECVKANIDVALRVLNPELPINPGIVKVKTILNTETALTFLANSITLTPGTLCVDIDGEEGFLYIHWIDVKTKDVEEASKIIVKRFENILKKVFE